MDEKCGELFEAATRFNDTLIDFVGQWDWEAAAHPAVGGGRQDKSWERQRQKAWHGWWQEEKEEVINTYRYIIEYINKIVYLDQNSL